MLTKLKKAILTNPGSAEENLRILHMQRLDKIRVKISDKDDPRQQGTYRYDEETNEFVEITGKSNYFSRFEPEEFMEALRSCGYDIAVSEVA